MSFPKQYTAAQQRILFPGHNPLRDDTRSTMVFHTMDGYLSGTEATFRSNGPDGVRSHFGISGSWDTPYVGDSGGKIVQWETTDRIAPAQFDGNPFAVSVETSDGANPRNPWTPGQIRAIVALSVDWCRAYGKPSWEWCSTPAGERGTFGYHEMFDAWNHNHHDCPGPVRKQQLFDVVVPAVNAALGDSGGTFMAALSDDQQQTVLKAAEEWLASTGNGQKSPSSTVHSILGTVQGLVNDSRTLTSKVDALSAKLDEVLARLP